MSAFFTPAYLIPLLALTAWPVVANVGNSHTHVIQAEELQWGYLNPLRGDKSPGAADLWGDRTKNTATGMLVRFNKGFSSPPHIHNITYRGVVIEGLVHNDDPSAEPMWLPTASYWTQPAGENHITAANGGSNLIYLEIEGGPYLVKPFNQQFDSGERPINVHASNLVWLGQDASSLIKGQHVAIAHLWQSSKNEALFGSLLKLPANFNATISSSASEFRAVVIKGKVTYPPAATKATKHLLPGSYFSSSGLFTHSLSVSEESIVYVRTNELFKVSPAF